MSADGRPLCLLRLILALGQNRTLEPSDPVRRDPRGVRDLVRGLAGPDAVLDLLGSQRILHFDLVLSEPRELTLGHRPQPFVDGQQEPSASAWHGEDRVTAVLADCDQAQLLHSLSLLRLPGRTGADSDQPSHRRVWRDYPAQASTSPGMSRTIQASGTSLVRCPARVPVDQYCSAGYS